MSERECSQRERGATTAVRAALATTAVRPALARGGLSEERV
jgi:hypothetical protein